MIGVGECGGHLLWRMSTAKPAQTTSRRTRWALAIEASNPSSGPVGVAGALLDEAGGLGEILEIQYEAGARRSDGLMPAIEALRGALGVRPDSLGLVCVSVGPGGYTGLRISVTVGKSLAAATGAGLVGVPSAAVALGDRGPESGCIVCLASKGDATHATVFGSGFGSDLSATGQPVGVIRAADVAGLIGPAVIADAFLPDSIRDACGACGKRIELPRFSAKRCLAIGYGMEVVDPASLVPVYAREPEAVRIWRDRHGQGA